MEIDANLVIEKLINEISTLKMENILLQIKLEQLENVKKEEGD